MGASAKEAGGKKAKRPKERTSANGTLLSQRHSNVLETALNGGGTDENVTNETGGLEPGVRGDPAGREGMTTALKRQDPSQAFDNWYMSVMTEEFADDLDKVRRAPDFKDSSMPVLRTALRQGTALYAEGARASVMRPGSGGASAQMKGPAQEGSSSP